MSASTVVTPTLTSISFGFPQWLVPGHSSQTHDQTDDCLAGYPGSHYRYVRYSPFHPLTHVSPLLGIGSWIAIRTIGRVIRQEFQHNHQSDLENEGSLHNPQAEAAHTPPQRYTMVRPTRDLNGVVYQFDFNMYFTMRSMKYPAGRTPGMKPSRNAAHRSSVFSLLVQPWRFESARSQCSCAIIVNILQGTRSLVARTP